MHWIVPFTTVCTIICISIGCSSDKSDNSGVNSELPIASATPETAQPNQVMPVEIGEPGSRPNYINADLLAGNIAFKFSQRSTDDVNVVGSFDYENYSFYKPSLIALNDINGDGLNDFAITTKGQHYVSTTPPQASIIHGVSGGWPNQSSIESEGRFIDQDGIVNLHNISALGDVNGDGLADLGMPPWIPNAVAQQNNLLDALLILDLSGLLVENTFFDIDKTTSIRLTNTDTSERVPGRIVRQMHRVGDINGDSYDDYLVEYPFDSTHPVDTPDSYLVFGSSNGGTIFDLNNINGSVVEIDIVGADGVAGDFLDDTFAMAVSPPADINGDGLDDIVFSLSNRSPLELKKYSLQPPHIVLFGRQAEFPVGISMPDFVDTDNNGLLFSHAQVPDSLQATPSEQTRNSRIDRFHSIGDINADGYDDLLVVQSPERLIILAGGFTQKQWFSLDWGDENTTGNHVGLANFFDHEHPVVGVGDVDGDGIDDLAIRHYYSMPGQAPDGTQRVILIYGDNGYIGTETGESYDVTDSLTVIDASGAFQLRWGTLMATALVTWV